MNRQIQWNSLNHFTKRGIAVLVSLLLVSSWGKPERAIAQPTVAPAEAENSSKPGANSAVQPLKQGTPIERELSPGEAHSYQVTLQAEQYLNLIVEQQSIDVVMTLFAPNGQQLIAVNQRQQGEPELIDGVAPESGIYRIEVRAADKVATPGRYALRIEELRATTEQDRKRFAANRILADAETLYKQGTEESRKQAIAKFKEAATLYQSIGDKATEAKAINSIGFIYSSLGEKQQAFEYYKQALPLFQAIGDRYAEGVVLDNMGNIYAFLGDYQKAIESSQQALSIFRAIKKPASEAIALNNIATIYKQLNDKKQSLEYYNQALQILRNAGNQKGIATLLDNIGSIYSDLGNQLKALEYYRQALPIWQALGDRREEAVNLINIGFVHNALGENQKALNYLQQALPLIKTAGDKSRMANILNNIGATYADLGDQQKALDHYNQALTLRRTLADTEGVAQTLFNIAFIERKKGNFSEAKTQIEEALKIIENLRSNVTNQELRTSFFASKQDYYEFYIDLLMQLHKKDSSEGYDALALQTSERTRARSLLEILAESGADIRSGADPKLLDREKQLSNQLNDLEKKRIQLLSGEHTEQQAAEINKTIDNLLADYQTLKAQIRATSPHYAALTQPQPLTLQEIQSIVLDDNTILLEYSLGKERSYLWVVTKTNLTSYELPKRAEIEAVAKQFRNALTVPALRSSPNLIAKASADLSELILKPTAEKLGKKRLLIVSDGALQYIPFAALTLPSKVAGGVGSNLAENPSRKQTISEENLPLSVPLIVDREVVNLPSASTLAILRRDTAGRKPAPKAIALFADPIFGRDDERIKGNIPNNTASLPVEAQQLERAASDAGVEWNRLPFTRTEAEKILALVPESESFGSFDFTANRDTATSPKLSQYRIIHFATHGFANSENPELSGIVMSLVDESGKLQNGYLRLHDIFNLNLPAELVVLSACQTGLGKEIKGEGLVGLTRGFMYAGAPRVVVSLWSVNDQATSELMVRFYGKMLKDKLAPSAALRAAQIELLQQTEWQSPYYWAAFGLQGEWK